MSTVLAEDLAVLLDRDLGRLTEQLAAYPDDASLWRVGGTTKNAPGTLALHLVGNLEAYIGAVFGGTGYVRDRDAEFSRRDVPRAEILMEIEACRKHVAAALPNVTDDTMVAPYPGPLPPPFAGWSTHRFLTHLCGHFLWHLGQIDYHRRIVVEGAGA